MSSQNAQTFLYSWGANRLIKEKFHTLLSSVFPGLPKTVPSEAPPVGPKVVVFHQSIVAFLLVYVDITFARGEPIGTGTVTMTRALSVKAIDLGANATCLSNKIRKSNSSCSQSFTWTWFRSCSCRIIGSLCLEILPFLLRIED